MVQRLGLAQALIGDPEIVVLDEPMSVLDPIGRKDVRDLIFSLLGEGRTVLFSTHILYDVEAICDRIGIIAQGVLTDCGTLSSLLTPGVRAVEVVAQNAPKDLVAFFFQAEDGIRDKLVTGVQTCALPICRRWFRPAATRTRTNPRRPTPNASPRPT